MRGAIIRILICVFVLSFFLYSYLDKQNGVTTLRIKIPELIASINLIKEENTRLAYEIEQFENPNHLMQLARHSEFRHLRHPFVSDILVLEQGKVSTDDVAKTPQTLSKTSASLALGAKQ